MLKTFAVIDPAVSARNASHILVAHLKIIEPDMFDDDVQTAGHALSILFRSENEEYAELHHRDPENSDLDDVLDGASSFLIEALNATQLLPPHDAIERIAKLLNAEKERLRRNLDGYTAPIERKSA